MQDYYETLQVHPRADPESIHAAYLRLRERYDTTKLEGVADEIQALARQRRDAIERAYTVLGDTQRRAAYDAELALRAGTSAGEPEATATADDDDDLIDYRPLAPARRQERPADFNSQPTLAPGQLRAQGHKARGRTPGDRPNGGMPAWIAPALIVAIATFGIVLVTLMTTMLNTPAPTTSTGGPQVIDPNAPTVAPTTSIVEIANQFEAQIAAAKQVASQVPDNANAWVELGNTLYDSVVVVRERLERGDPQAQAIYVERLPRWLEAAEAYRKALAINAVDAAARADLAASLCYYGEGVNDPAYVQQGIDEAERAITDQPEEGRALLSAGLCYALADPPQTPKALEQWQRLVVLPNADPSLIFQARQLIQQYSR